MHICMYHWPRIQVLKTSWASPTFSLLRLSLHKILFYLKTLLWETILLLLPPLTCKAYLIAIPLHGHCSIYAPPPTSLLYARQHTILMMAISCKGQSTTQPLTFPVPILDPIFRRGGPSTCVSTRGDLWTREVRSRHGRKGRGSTRSHRVIIIYIYIYKYIYIYIYITRTRTRHRVLHQHRHKHTSGYRSTRSKYSPVSYYSPGVRRGPPSGANLSGPNLGHIGWRGPSMSPTPFL